MKSFFSKPNSSKTQRVTQGLGPEIPLNKTNNRKRNIIIFVVFLLFSFITTPLYFLPPDGLFIKLGFFGSEQSLQQSGLAGASIVSMAAMVAIPLFAGLHSTLAILGLNWLKEKQVKRLLAYIFLAVVGLGVTFPVYLIISYRFSQNKEIGSIPSKVGFQIYKPNKNNPFKGFNES